MKYKSMEERLMFNSILDPATGCWDWIGKVSYKGYGHVSVRTQNGPRNRMAHRVAFEELRGEKIPDNMTLDHKCRNKRCINPDHQEIVTRVENTVRRNDYYRKAA
jgi:ABC-type iron transport system FetAB ATPase subunit